MATASSPAGTYAIDGAGLAATNYTFEQASNATALQLTERLDSTTMSPQQCVATIVAQLQQAPQSGSGNKRQDDDTR